MTRCRLFRTVEKDEREKGAMPEETATDGSPHMIVPGEVPPEPAPEPVEEPAAGAPVPPVSPDLDTAEPSDEPLGVKADDGDDPGLLEQIAEAMGELWDDSKGMVT
jgi:hypothetical protein